MPTNSNKKASDPRKINSHSTSSKKTQLHHNSTKIVKPACISSGLCLLARSLPFTEDTLVSHRSYRSSAGITEWLRFLPRRQSETCHGIKLSCRLVASNGGGCKDCNWQLGSRVLSINSSVMMASQESDSHMWNWFQKSFSLDFPFLSGQSSKVHILQHFFTIITVGPRMASQDMPEINWWFFNSTSAPFLGGNGKHRCNLRNWKVMH